MRLAGLQTTSVPTKQTQCAGKPAYKSWAALAILVVAISVIGVPSAFGQYAVTGYASATVQTALTVTATQPLLFAEAYPGVLLSQDKDNDDSTAIFTVTGTEDAGINLTFYLPEYLALADGSDRMTIFFGGTDAAVDTTAAGTPSTMVGGSGWDDENPQALTTAADIGSVSTRVYLGGKIQPSVVQKAGTYTGDIILIVAYNGS